MKNISCGGHTSTWKWAASANNLEAEAVPKAMPWQITNDGLSFFPSSNQLRKFLGGR